MQKYVIDRKKILEKYTSDNGFVPRINNSYNLIIKRQVTQLIMGKEPA